MSAREPVTSPPKHDARPSRGLLSGRKVRDRALILPLIGMLFLIPPVGAIFQLDVRIAGIPFTALYLFGVWAALIVGAALLARPLRDSDPGSG